MRRVVAIFALTLSLIACGTATDTAEPPAELVRIDAVLELDRVWSVSVGDAGESLRLGIAPSTDGETVYAAGMDGEVSAITIADGQWLWRVDTDREIAAGPAVGDGIVVVSDSDGRLTALSAADGAELWQADVHGEVLASAAIARGRVVVRITDGRLMGLDASTGETLWRIDRETPPISLRGNSAPVVIDERVLVGTDAGKVIAVRMEDGRLLWETPIATPRGATIIERMVDVDGQPVVLGSDVFAVSYQGRAAMLGLESGQVFWAVEANSNRTPAVDGLSLFISASDGVIHRLDRRSGAPRWQQDALRARSLTGPVLHGESVVVGDLEGYLHWFNREDGSMQARVRAGSAQVLDPLLLVGDLLIAQTRDGKVAAFRVAAD
jgi:outer membrane protein assembly factor BamB